jgi:hypothetical protein
MAGRDSWLPLPLPLVGRREELAAIGGALGGTTEYSSDNPRRFPMGTRKIGRDAKTGTFIPVKEAKRRPGSTVVETVKTAKKKRK